MSAAIRLCVAYLSFSALSVDCAGRDVDPETSALTEDGQARCVDITANLSSCRRLGYRQMRVPSLLNDTSANTTSAAAAALIDSCREDGLVFMCSLLAPVCIDRPIWPCASLCRNVTATCPDVAALVDCSALPPDDQLCIGPHSTGRKVSSNSTQTVFDARLQRPQRKRFGRPGSDSGRGSWKARRASSRRTRKPSTRRSGKWNVSNSREMTASEATNTTVTTSCSVCADQLSSSGLTERLCNAEFVAKVRPSRYIRAGASLKLLASKSTKFYKMPKSSAPLSSKRRAVFFLHGTSAAYCPCLQVPGVVDRPPRGRRGGGGGGGDDGSLLVAGRLDQVGGRRRHTRLVVTAVLPLSSRTLVRRAVRLSRNADLCEQRTPRTEHRSRPGRRRRPDGMMSDEHRNGQVADNGRRRDGRRSRLQERVADGARQSRRKKSQRNRRGRQRQN